MSAFLTVDLRSTVASSQAVTRCHAAVSDTRFPRHRPFVIPSSQRYYWEMKWQMHEREAREEYERGEFEEFRSDDPSDIVRWLFSD